MAPWKADFAVAFHDTGGRGVVRDLSARGLLALALEGLEHLAAFPAKERNGALFEGAQRQLFDETGGRRPRADERRRPGRARNSRDKPDARKGTDDAAVGRWVGRNMSFTVPRKRLLPATLAPCGFSAR